MRRELRQARGRKALAGGPGFLESVLGSEGLLHGAVAQKRDPQADCGNLRPGIDEGDGFHKANARSAGRSERAQQIRWPEGFGSSNCGSP